MCLNENFVKRMCIKHYKYVQTCTIRLLYVCFLKKGDAYRTRTYYWKLRTYTHTYILRLIKVIQKG